MKDVHTITAKRHKLVNGNKIINGYSVSLTKSQIEDICKMKEGTQVNVKYAESGILITKEE